MEEPKVLIIGYGVVGKALHKSFKNSVEVDIIDPLYNYSVNYNTKKYYDFIFICVNVPNLIYKTSKIETQDCSVLESILSNIRISENLKHSTIVIRSTILPENVEKMIQKYDNLCFVMNPEFLTEYSSFDNSEKICILGSNCVGASKKLQYFYENFTNYKFEYFEYCSPKEALEVKYARNCLGALKVLYFHILHECGFNSRKIEHILKKFEGVDPQGLMAKISPDGKKGFGGKCFIKDTEAMSFSDNSNAKTFFKTILEINNELRDS